MVDNWEPPGTYGVVQTANRERVYVTMDVYDKLGEVLDAIRDTESFDMPMFVKFVDLLGSEMRIRVVQIESMWESTPTIRDRDKIMEKSRKHWDDDN